jgi:hypothetical protein
VRELRQSLRVDSQDEQVRPETLKVCVDTPGRPWDRTVDSRGSSFPRRDTVGDLRNMMLRSLEYHFILPVVMALPLVEELVPLGLQHETSEVDPWQEGEHVPSRQQDWYVGGGASGNGPTGQQLGWFVVCVCGGGGGGLQRASGGS